MPLRPTDLPLGLSLIHAPGQGGIRTLLERWRRDLAAVPGSNSTLARLAIVEGLDPSLAAHPDPAVRRQHLESLLPAISKEPEDPARRIELEARRREILTVIDRAPSDAPVTAAFPPGGGAAWGLLQEDHDRWQQEREELRDAQAKAAQHLENVSYQLRRVDNEIRRDLHGIATVPDAARQVTKLGEAQAEAKREYLTLQEQRKELQQRRVGMEAVAKKSQGEQGRKIMGGILFALLGMGSYFSPGVPAHLRPLGLAVIVLGVLLAVTGRAPKKGAKQVQLERQEADLDKQTINAENDLREADRSVRTFCQQVGCTTPAQVIDLQRRYEMIAAERERLADEVIQAEAGITALQEQVADYDTRLERWLQEVGAPTFEELGRRIEAARSGSTAPTTTPSPTAVMALEDEASLRLELGVIERELTRLDSRAESPLEQAVELANGWVRAWGEGVQALELAEITPSDMRFRGPAGRAGSISELDEYGQVVLYLLARAALLETFTPQGAKLPLVLDDPLRFWEDAALGGALAIAQALAGPARRLAFVTNRSHLIGTWRNQGPALTVIELEDGSDIAAGT